jgi:integrase
VVYLSPDVATALQQWHGLQAPADYVFPSPMRRQRGLPLGARQIRNRMARYLKLAGITKRHSPHSLRHYLAPRVMLGDELNTSNGAPYALLYAA